MVVDTLALQPEFIAKNKGAVESLIKGWYAALDMIRTQPDKAFEIMGKRVNQDGRAFQASAEFIEWQDRAKNQAFAKGELTGFMTEAAEVLKDTGVIRAVPELGKLYDGSFVA